jgi:hypothetical protein
MSTEPQADLLVLLQRKDGHRHWRSLDDERVCLLCHRLFTGRDIRVIEGQDGESEIHCPTADCNSTPRDWFFHGSIQPSPGPLAPDVPRKIEVDFDLG